MEEEKLINCEICEEWVIPCGACVDCHHGDYWEAIACVCFDEEDDYDPFEGIAPANSVF